VIDRYHKLANGLNNLRHEIRNDPWNWLAMAGFFVAPFAVAAEAHALAWTSLAAFVIGVAAGYRS